MTIDDAIHDRWAKMTDGGKLDNRVENLERACDDFFNQQHGRYCMTTESRSLFHLFRACAVAALKRQIVHELPGGSKLDERPVGWASGSDIGEH